MLRFGPHKIQFGHSEGRSQRSEVRLFNISQKSTVISFFRRVPFRGIYIFGVLFVRLIS